MQVVRFRTALASSFADRMTKLIAEVGEGGFTVC